MRRAVLALAALAAGAAAGARPVRWHLQFEGQHSPHRFGSLTFSFPVD